MGELATVMQGDALTRSDNGFGEQHDPRASETRLEKLLDAQKALDIRRRAVHLAGDLAQQGRTLSEESRGVSDR